MSKYYGDIAEDETIRIPFNTFNSDGASVTVTDLATTDVEISKDGTVLGDPDAGVTLSLNHSADTGAHLVIIDTNSDAQYVTGSDYQVKLIGITVDTQTLNVFIGSFSIENRFMRGTDGANTTVPDAAGVAPTAVENRQEMDSNSTQLAAIALDTGTTLENRQVAILADVTGLNGDAMRGTDGANTTVPDAAGTAASLHSTTDGLITTVDTVVDAIKVVTDNLADSATTIVSGTVAATAASTTIFFSDDVTEATADHYNGRIVIFTSGALQNQATDITDYELSGGEGKFTVTALTETPANDDTFVIV